MTNSMVLPVRLDLAASETLAANLLDKRGDDLWLDAKSVDHLGGAAAEVLVSAKKCWAKDGHVLHLAHPSPQITDALATLGLDDLLPISEVPE